ncbi:MAG TPA: hypothetical protein VF223_28445 [Trebonia sp.]
MTGGHHASLTHPDLQEITIRRRTSYGVHDRRGGEDDAPGQDDEPIPLRRIEYLGDDGQWGFALYDPAAEACTPALPKTGEPARHPNDAYDTAALVHLTDHQK